MNTKTLDIIIPAYNAKDTLVRCLSSIAMQTIRDQIVVTVINDCSTDGSYAEIINKFTDCMGGLCSGCRWIPAPSLPRTSPAPCTSRTPTGQSGACRPRPAT